MDFTVGKAFDGLSLGDFLRRAGVGSGLLAHCKRVPRGILLNGRPVTVRARVAAGDAVFLFAEDAAENGALLPADLPFEELFCRGGVRVAGKPAGMPTHPSHGHREDTLANALKYRYGREDPAFCPRFVNRLDRDTTGTVLVAFDRYAAGYLSRAMAAGEIGKRYLAICPPDGMKKRPVLPERSRRRPPLKRGRPGRSRPSRILRCSARATRSHCSRFPRAPGARISSGCSWPRWVTRFWATAFTGPEAPSLRGRRCTPRRLLFPCRRMGNG